MNVSAIVVTRGGKDLTPIWESLPKEWERVCWDNSGFITAWLPHGLSEQTGHVIAHEKVSDFSVYGRYAAIEFASHDLIYVQDDDCVVSDPQELVDAWDEMETLARIEQTPDSETAFLVANMPQEFRHDGYTDSCLVGFGACFHRDAPARAFERVFPFMIGPGGSDADWEMFTGFDADGKVLFEIPSIEWFHRTCDVVFTTLTPRVLVDVPKVNREFAEDASRMYRQPGHTEERQRMLELARKVRDG